MQVVFENGYLTAHVDMLRHQHKQTTKILSIPLTPASVTTALNNFHYPKCSTAFLLPLEHQLTSGCTQANQMTPRPS